MRLRRRVPILADALQLINRDGCENLTRGRCSGPGSGRIRGAKYGADAWCAPCVADDALRRAGQRVHRTTEEEQ